MSNGSKVINSINKAINILELLHADDDGFTVSEISAAPVLGANNTAIAAISLSGPSFRMTEQNLITVSEELKKAAKELGKELASL